MVYFGEFIGTFVLFFIGSGLTNRSSSITVLGWSIALALGICAAWRCGAPGYLNPVGPANGIWTGKLNVYVALGYQLSQLFGGLLAVLMLKSIKENING